MSFIVYPATVITNTSMITITPTQQMTDCVMIEIYNDSTYGLSVILPGNNQIWVGPGTGVFQSSNDYYGQDIKITPMNVMAGVFSGIPQQLTIMGFNKGESTPPTGTTIDISKVVVVANTVNTTSGTSTAVVNQGNTTNTPVVTGQVSGDPSDGVLINNNGNTTLGTVANPAELTVNGANGGTAILAATGDIKCLGNIIANIDYKMIDNGSNPRPFAAVNSTTNDNTIFTNVNHGILHIMNSAQTSDIATFADTNLITTLFGMLNFNVSALTTNGSTSGTTSLYQISQGVVKIVFVYFNNMRNGGGSTSTVLPTAFTVGGLVWSTNINSVSFNSSGTGQNFDLVTTVSPTGGTTTSEFQIASNCSGVNMHPFDTFVFNGAAGTAHTGFLLVIGQ